MSMMAARYANEPFDFDEWATSFIPIYQFFVNCTVRLSGLTSLIMETIIWKQNQVGFKPKSSRSDAELNKIVLV